MHSTAFSVPLDSGVSSRLLFSLQPMPKMLGSPKTVGVSHHVPRVVTEGTWADETWFLGAGNQPGQQVQAQVSCPAGHSSFQWQVPTFPTLAFEVLSSFNSAIKFYKIYGKAGSVRPLSPMKFDWNWSVDFGRFMDFCAKRFCNGLSQVRCLYFFPPALGSRSGGLLS